MTRRESIALTEYMSLQCSNVNSRNTIVFGTPVNGRYRLNLPVGEAARDGSFVLASAITGLTARRRVTFPIEQLGLGAKLPNQIRL